jgi:hypothetical protein
LWASHVDGAQFGAGLPSTILTSHQEPVAFSTMSILELKQRVSRLSKRQRQDLYCYLVRLKHDTPEWKRATAKRIDAMKRGKFVTAEELEARVRRG